MNLLVSYAHETTKSLPGVLGVKKEVGFGNNFVETNNPPSSQDDIDYLTNKIKGEYGYSSVVIICITKLGE